MQNLKRFGLGDQLGAAPRKAGRLRRFVRGFARFSALILVVLLIALVVTLVRGGHFPEQKSSPSKVTLPLQVPDSPSTPTPGPH